MGPDAGDSEPDPVNAGHCGDVERAGIPATPGEVVRALRQAYGAQVLTGRREQPDAARPAHVHVAGRVDLDPADGVLTVGAGGVEEHLTAGHRAIAVEGIPHDDLVIRIAVAD